MYAQNIYIDTSKCDRTKCNGECVTKGPNVFAIDSRTNKATVKVPMPFSRTIPPGPSQEEEAGFAIENCPKGAIWGRGEGEAIGHVH
jgi:ferredoxin